MKLEVKYRVVRPSAIVELIPTLDTLRLDGRTGMWRFLKDVREQPAYMETMARVALAYVDGRLVGWASLCNMHDVLFNVFVQERYRGFGIGTRLVRELAEVYTEVAKIPPTILRHYRLFYKKAIPHLLIPESKQADHFAR